MQMGSEGWLPWSIDKATQISTEVDVCSDGKVSRYAENQSLFVVELASPQ